MKITQVEWGTIARAAFKDYPKDQDDVPGLAAEMAYWIVFSLFPLFAFLAFLAGILGRVVGVEQSLEQITTTVLSPLGAESQEQLRGQLAALLENGGALSFGAVVSAVLALNAASAAVATTMKAFNRAYGVRETRNAVAAKLTALALTLVLVVLLVGGALLLTLGGRLAVVFDIGVGGQVLLWVGRIVGATLGISLALAILYWKGPNVQQQFQWISPGSVLATVALIVFSVAFAYYIQLIGRSSFAKTYGAVAGVIIFLFFLRYASTIVLLGAEFNAEAAKRYDPETIRDKITDPRKMLPGQPPPHPQARREAGVSEGQVATSNAVGAQRVVAGQVGAGAAPGVVKEAGAVAAGDYGDSEVAEQLRRLREQPVPTAAAQARRAQERLPATERTRRARVALAALGVSVATTLGEVLFIVRRARR